MRITTQMLNESAMKSGLAFKPRTLLDYMKTDGTGNSLLEALNASRLNKSGTAKKESYEKLGDASDNLLKQAERLLDDGEDSVFGKLAEDESEENRELLYQNVEGLTDSYNKMLKELKASPGTLNNYYRKMLTEAASHNKEALEAIGISLNSDRTMVLDKEKLQTGDIETIKKTMSDSGTFTTKLALIAASVSDNAAANADSLSNRYNALGNTYSSVNSKYDFRS